MDESAQAAELARVLWDFHCVHKDPTEPADVILAMGSHDVRVAETAAQLWLSGAGHLLVASGGSGKVTSGLWTKPEAEVFADIALARGVDPSKLFVESSAKNSGQNITLSRNLLKEAGISVNNGLLVTKPYMRRRALATAEKQWAEIDWYVSSPAIGFDDYPTPDVPLDRMINLMVGDLQRLDVYANQGFQVKQDIPPRVWEAWHKLVTSGYDQFVIREAG